MWSNPQTFEAPKLGNEGSEDKKNKRNKSYKDIQRYSFSMNKLLKGQCRFCQINENWNNPFWVKCNKEMFDRKKEFHIL